VEEDGRQILDDLEEKKEEALLGPLDILVWKMLRSWRKIDFVMKYTQIQTKLDQPP